MRMDQVMEIHLVRKFLSNVKSMFRGKTLTSQSAQGGIWIGIGNGSEQILRLLRNIILTRILLPEDFGLMAIVLSVSALFEALTQIGIENAVIQNPNGNERTFLNGTWWISMARALGTYGLGFMLVPLLSNFYKSPDLVPLIRVAFIAVVFRGAMSPGAFSALKRLKYKVWIAVFHGGGGIGIIAAIIVSFYIRSVWALVIGYVAEEMARMVLSYLLCPFRPGFQFNKEHIKSLLKFVRGMLGISLLYFIFMRLDIFVIGKLLPKSILGIYSMATRLARIPFLFLTAVISRALLPAFSQMQEDDNRTNAFLIKIVALIYLLCVPALFVVVFNSNGILALAYGKQYAQASVAFTLVFTSELFRMIIASVNMVHMSRGSPHIVRQFALIRGFVFAVLIVPSVIFMGIVGAALSGLIATIVTLVIQLYNLKRLTGINIGKFAVMLLWALVSSIIIGIVHLLMTNFIPANVLLKVVFGIISCCIAYGLLFFNYLRLKIL